MISMAFVAFRNEWNVFQILLVTNSSLRFTYARLNDNKLKLAKKKSHFHIVIYGGIFENVGESTAYLLLVAVGHGTVDVTITNINSRSDSLAHFSWLTQPCAQAYRQLGQK